MDYDGANVQFLTDSRLIVLAPRFQPDGRPDPLHQLRKRPPADLRDGHRRPCSARPLERCPPSNMTFAPRFTPDGRSVVFSMSRAAIPTSTARSCAAARDAADERARRSRPRRRFSPDGSQIVFESDRSGTQQIYVMPAGGGEPRADQPRHRAATARRSGRRAAISSPSPSRTRGASTSA